MSLNQVCIIDGDYNVTFQSSQISASCSPVSKRIQEKLSQLIDSYKSKMKLNADNQEGTQLETSASDYSKFVLIHSKDGSELYTNLLQSFGLNVSDLDNTLNSNAGGGDTTMSTVVTSGGVVNKTQQRTTNTNYTTFVCFLISDFDQNDKVFAKLEETQLKLSNFLNALSSNLTNTSSASQKRFMIFGWPVLHYCLENNLVIKF